MKVHEIARFAGGTVEGDSDREISGVAALETAGPSDLVFAEGSQALDEARQSRAGCILVPSGVSLPGQTTVTVAQPKLAFIQTAGVLKPPPRQPAGMHPTAIIGPGASLGADVSIGPHAVIGPGVRVGARTGIGAGVVIGESAAIGEDCVLYPGVTIYPQARIGNRVTLHAGVVIGGDGFGYVFAEGRHLKFPQVGSVVVEDEVEIGCNSTVDRGSLGTTVIGTGTKIDNLVQIAHNVRIGKHCVIAAQTGISGSATVEDYAVLAGQVGIADHVVIEEGARVGAKAGVPTGKIVRRGTTVWGIPARPLDVFKRQYAHLSRLPDLFQRVGELEERLTERTSPHPLDAKKS